MGNARRIVALVAGILAFSLMSGFAGVETFVHYGDKIKLRHKLTNKKLDARNKNYSHPKTSQQRIIGCTPEGSWWIVKGRNAANNRWHCTLGEVVKGGHIIRLESEVLGYNLHGHVAPSPITQQQEVTGFALPFGPHPGSGIGDDNCNWVVSNIGTENLELGKQVKFVHTLTSKALHSHNIAPSPLTDGMQEVTGYGYPPGDDNDWWIIDEVQPAQIFPPVEVIYARYGADPNKWVDVAKKVSESYTAQGFFQFGGNLTALFGTDPAPGAAKVVDISIKGYGGVNLWAGKTAGYGAWPIIISNAEGRRYAVGHQTWKAPAPGDLFMTCVVTALNDVHFALTSELKPMNDKSRRSEMIEIVYGGWVDATHPSGTASCIRKANFQDLVRVAKGIEKPNQNHWVWLKVDKTGKEIAFGLGTDPDENVIMSYKGDFDPNLQYILPSSWTTPVKYEALRPQPYSQFRGRAEKRTTMRNQAGSANVVFDTALGFGYLFHENWKFAEAGNGYCTFEVSVDNPSQMGLIISPEPKQVGQKQVVMSIGGGGNLHSYIGDGSVTGGGYNAFVACSIARDDYKHGFIDEIRKLNKIKIETNPNVVLTKGVNQLWLRMYPSKVAEKEVTVLIWGKGTEVGNNPVQSVVLPYRHTGKYIGFYTNTPATFSKIKFSSKEVLNLPVGWTAMVGEPHQLSAGSDADGYLLGLMLEKDGEVQKWNPNSETNDPWDLFKTEQSAGVSVGEVVNIAASDLNEVLVLTKDGQVWKYNNATKLFVKHGPALAGLDKIAAGKDLWACNSTTKTIYRFDAAKKVWQEMKDQNGTGGIDVSASIDGAVYKVTENLIVRVLVSDTNWEKIKKDNGDDLLANNVAVSKKGYALATYDRPDNDVNELYEIVNNVAKPMLGADGKPATGPEEISVNSVGSGLASDDDGTVVWRFGYKGYIQPPAPAAPGKPAVVAKAPPAAPKQEVLAKSGQLKKVTPAQKQAKQQIKKGKPAKLSKKASPKKQAAKKIKAAKKVTPKKKVK